MNKSYYICNEATEILLEHKYVTNNYHKIESVFMYELNKENWDKFLEHIEKCNICTLNQVKKDMPLLKMFLQQTKIRS